MTTFAIDCDNNITAFALLKEAKAADLAGAEYFSSQEELEQLAASWSPAGTRGRGSSKLMELWNSLPGVVPVKKFTNRQTALARIWKAAQALTPAGAPQGAQDAPKAKGSRKKATSRKKAAPAQTGEAREGSKKAQVLALLRRPEGATLQAIAKATSWQAHTVRGFISGTLIKKQHLKVESFRNDQKERTYRVPA
ncbi:MAG: DUF3489 domain-containing protein [Terriglobia bacterium]